MLVLFALYERLCALGGMLILAASTSPAAIGLKLADLATRLTAGLVYQLQPLTAAEKIAALRLRAQRRGLTMTEEVANYLLTRFPAIRFRCSRCSTSSIPPRLPRSGGLPFRSCAGWSKSCRAGALPHHAPHTPHARRVQAYPCR